MRGRCARVLAIVVMAMLAPAAAHAQLPPIPPAPGLPPDPGGGDPQPPAPPPNGPAAGPGEVVSYQGDPAHTGAASEEAVFGPLEPAWTHAFPASVGQPLIVAGKVIVNARDGGSSAVGSHVFAFDAATGRELWQQPTPGTYDDWSAAPIAANSGRVFSVSPDGVVRAFEVDTGAPAWSVALPVRLVLAPPVAAAGTVFVSAFVGDDPHSATVFALAASDGAVRWKESVPVNASAWPTLDGERVFLSDCDGAYALAQTTGQRVWGREHEGSCRLGFGIPVVTGGRLLTKTDEGFVYDAASGRNGNALPGGAPDALAGDLGYRADGTAVPLDGGPPRWTFEPAPSDTSDINLRPIVVGPTVYEQVLSGDLYGLDRLTGEVLTVTKFPEVFPSRLVDTGMSAGAGVLVATEGSRLRAFRSIFHPASDGIDAGANGFDVVSGRRRTIAAALGRDLRGSTPTVQVRLDEHPFRRDSPSGSLKVLADGMAYGRLQVWRNTRVRFAVGARRSDTITVYGYPRTRSRVRRTSRTRGLLRVTMRADSHFRPAGRRLVFYFGRARDRRYVRLGTGRMRQAGRGVAKGSVGFRLLRRVRPKDTIAFCVRGLPRLGYGRNDGFQRRCGRRAITFAAANSAR